MKKVIVAVTVIGVVGVGVVVASGTSEEKPVTPAPTAPEKPTSSAGEREDLYRFGVDDRSAHGFSDVWLTWEIKNNSSEKSDYSWEWEAVNSSGERVASGSEMEFNVLPGQVTKGDTPTVLEDGNVKLNITDFDRTKSY